MSNATAVQKAKALTPVEQRFTQVAQAAKLDELSPIEQQAALAWYGAQTGLRPELGEVMIYQGRFYVTLEGRVRNAHRNHLYVGSSVRPATEGEFRRSGYPAGTILWRAEVHRRGAAQPFVEWGKVTPDEIQQARSGRGRDHLPLAKAPADLAKKRAKMNANRDAFPLGEEIGLAHAEYIAEAEERILSVQGTTPAALAAPSDPYAPETPSDQPVPAPQHPEPAGTPLHEGPAAMIPPFSKGGLKGKPYGDMDEQQLASCLQWFRKDDEVRTKFAEHEQAALSVLADRLSEVPAVVLADLQGWIEKTTGRREALTDVHELVVQALDDLRVGDEAGPSE